MRSNESGGVQDSRRVAGLDLLRLLAVLLVISRHMAVPALLPFQLWQTGGWVGVDLFFVLSGFLVSGLLFKEHLRSGRIDVARFLVRRGFKIYPAFFLLIAVTIAFRWWSDQTPHARELVAEVLFLQNYLGGMWPHTWSLAVEEHFYFAIAALLWLLARRKGVAQFGSLPIVFAVVATACLLLRIVNLFTQERFTHMQFVFPTHLRIDSLMFGVLLSYLWHYRSLEQRIARIGSFSLVTIGTTLLAPAFLFSIEDHAAVSVVGFVSFYLGAGMLVIAARRMRVPANRLATAACELGAASYSIYLWHVPVIEWGWPMFKQATGMGNFAFYLSFCVFGSLGFGWLMNKAIEGPMLRLRDRMFPNHRGPGTP